MAKRPIRSRPIGCHPAGMTTPTGSQPGHGIGVPYPPGPPPYWPPQPSRKGRSPATLAVLSAVCGALGVALVAALLLLLKPWGGEPAAGPPDATATTTRPRVYPALEASDITIEILVVEKQCFGSAGCVITFEPELSLNTLLTYEPGSDWDVTYEVLGAEDPYIATMWVHVDGASSVRYSNDRAVVQTARTSDELTAEITSIRRR